MASRYTIANLWRSYAEAKLAEEWYGEWGAALLYRPLSLLLAPVLLRLGVSGNTVTVASLVLALSLPVLALLGEPQSFALVASVAMLAAILDCIDGTIARATGTSSRRGRYLDFLADVILRVSLYAAIGLLAEREVPRDAAVDWLALSGLAALLAIAARLCRIYGELMTGAAAYARPAGPRRGLLQFVFPLLSGLDPLLPFAVLAAGHWRLMAWIVLWLLAYSAGDFLYTQYAILRRLP